MNKRIRGSSKKEYVLKDNVTSQLFEKEIQNAKDGKYDIICCDSVRQFVRTLDLDSSDDVIEIMNDLGRRGIDIIFKEDVLRLNNYMCAEEIFKIGSLIGKATYELYLERRGIKEENHYVKVVSEYAEVVSEEEPYVKVVSEEEPYVKVVSEEEPYVKVVSEEGPYVKVVSDISSITVANESEEVKDE